MTKIEKRNEKNLLIWTLKFNKLRLTLKKAASLNSLLSTLQWFMDPASKLILKKNRFHKIVNTEVSKK